jgi:hypothetical protein
MLKSDFNSGEPPVQSFGQAIANGPNGTTQSYAMSVTGANQGTCEDTRGAGFGMIDVFDANGKLVIGELVPVGGLLNAPWGMALVPKDFGTLSNALLVSNHADGPINGRPESADMRSGARRFRSYALRWKIESFHKVPKIIHRATENFTSLCAVRPALSLI